MKTRVFQLGPKPSDWNEALEEASTFLSHGGLVAFPTETVYGLGANALNAEAVARIYEAKGRPPENPLIVHVSSFEEARSLVIEWPDIAEKLVRVFWPGALTLILEKSSIVPDIVTGGGPTVAIRMPSHPVARALLEKCRCPIAAPSANISEQLSATTAAHVLKGLYGKIEVVLDGGQTPGGLESTVLDLTVDPPVIRRPGLITKSMLMAVTPIGEAGEESDDTIMVSPGMMAKHYAPTIPLSLIEHDRLPKTANPTAGYLLLQETEAPANAAIIERLPEDAVLYSAELYNVLHRMEDAQIESIVVERPPEGDEWTAVHDRLQRAATRDS